MIIKSNELGDPLRSSILPCGSMIQLEKEFIHVSDKFCFSPVVLEAGKSWEENNNTYPWRVMEVEVWGEEEEIECIKSEPLNF